MRPALIDVDSDNRVNQILSTLAGAGVGALVGSRTRKKDGEKEEENNKRRRQRILRAAMIGGAAGLGHATIFPDRSVTLRQIMESNYDSPEHFQEVLDKARAFRAKIGDETKWIQSLDDDHLARRYNVHDMSNINTRPNRGTRVGQPVEDVLSRLSPTLRDILTMPLTDRLRSIRTSVAAPFFKTDKLFPPGVLGMVMPGTPGRIGYNMRSINRLTAGGRLFGPQPRQYARSVLGHEAMHRLQVAGLERRPGRLGGVQVRHSNPNFDAVLGPRESLGPGALGQYLDYLAMPVETEVRLGANRFGSSSQADLIKLRIALALNRSEEAKQMRHRFREARRLRKGLVGYSDHPSFMRKRSFFERDRMYSFERMASPSRGAAASLLSPPAAMVGSNLLIPGAPLTGLATISSEPVINALMRGGLDRESREKSREEALEKVRDKRVRRRHAVLGRLLGGVGWGAALTPLTYFAQGALTVGTPDMGRSLRNSMILGLALSAPGALRAATANKEDLSISASRELEKRRAKLKQEREDGDKED